MTQRASLEELKEFANKVREAGGGNPLDALMPAVPEESTNCLIAKNLNFNCEVNGDGGEWNMAVNDRDTRDRIAEALGLTTQDSHYDPKYRVVLPPEIGQVAADYDEVSEILNNIGFKIEQAVDEIEERRLQGEKVNDLSPEKIRLIAEEELEHRGDVTVEDIREFWPYIEESTREAYDLATLVNEDGSITL